MNNLNKKDYEEPRCPFDNSMWVKKEIIPIPSDRVISKEDEYLAKNDYAAAERHLLYWLDEAEGGNDGRGKFLICNELMGLYRKLGKSDKAMEYADKALSIAEELEILDTVGGATSMLNCATVYKAFGEPERSLELFEMAKDIYEEKLDEGDARKAGLYNNMALTLVDLGRYSEAEELYMSAIAISGNRNEDAAITWLNLADCAAARKGIEEAEEEIQGYLDRAQKLLEDIPEGERDSYYSYVCEKCAPVFDYYGYFVFAAVLRKRCAESTDERG